MLLDSIKEIEKGHNAYSMNSKLFFDSVNMENIVQSLLVNN